MYFTMPQDSTKLQSVLSSSTSGTGTTSDFEGHHHPLTCQEGELEYFEDDVFACKHSRTVSQDVRTKAAITHSICLLLFELIHDSQGKIKVSPWWT